MAFWNRKPRPAPSINVSITPNCVVRPGDAVLVSTEHTHSADVLRAAILEKLPDGVQLFLLVGDRAGASNLSRLLEERLNQFGDKCSCRSNGNPLDAAAATNDGSAEKREVKDKGAVTFDVTRAPVSVDELLPHGRASL